MLELSEKELWDYRSEQVDPPDFDEFWAATLAEARSHDLDVVAEVVDTGLRTLTTYDVTFRGFGGHPIKAWLRVPAGADSPLPAVVEYVGYGGGRGHVLDNLFWASSGFVHLLMDTRGQGSGWSTGDTPDPVGSGPAYPGVMTRGIEDPASYYYRRLFTDGVRAVEAVRTLEVVDPSRVFVTGGSQGGAITLAVAGLVPDLAGAGAKVPFLCDFPRALAILEETSMPYGELMRYLRRHRASVATVMETLQYFDGVNFALRATAPGWFSAALRDPICPPSTVFGAYHAYAAEKDVVVWPFNEHEGGEIEDDASVRDWFHRFA